MSGQWHQGRRLAALVSKLVVGAGPHETWTSTGARHRRPSMSSMDGCAVEPMDVGEEKPVSIAPIDIECCVLGGQFSYQDQVLGVGGVLCLHSKFQMFVEQSRRCRVLSFGPRIFRHFLLLESWRLDEAGQPTFCRTVSRFKGGLCSHPCQSATIFSGF